jgi:hypothetical protein
MYYSRLHVKLPISSAKTCLFIFVVSQRTRSCFDLQWLLIPLRKCENGWSYGAQSSGNLLSKSQNLQAVRTVREVLRLHRESGNIHNIFVQPRGGPRSLNQGDISYISSLLDANPTLYLDFTQLRHGFGDMKLRLLIRMFAHG